jgi:hypothetical protein
MSLTEYPSLVPELTVIDLETAISFYAVAGFAVRYQRIDPAFAYLEMGTTHLMLEEQHSTGWNTAVLERPFGRGVNFQIEVKDALGLAERYSQVGYRFYRELNEVWYRISDDMETGQIEVLLQDPDGYLLRFVQVLGERRSVER